MGSIRAFRLLQGIAAWDVIRFTIPDGVTGCFIPVVVQIGGFVSNLATLSIDPGGAACAPIPSTLPAALTQQLAGKPNVKFGSISLSRGIGMSGEAASGRRQHDQARHGVRRFQRRKHTGIHRLLP